MNTLRSLCLSALTLVASASAMAATPSIQAPTPSIDTQWALAAVEEAPSQYDAAPVAQPVLVTQDANSWKFTDVINGQLIEIQVTEIVATMAQKIAQHTAKSALDLAGL